MDHSESVETIFNLSEFPRPFQQIQACTNLLRNTLIRTSLMFDLENFFKCFKDVFLEIVQWSLFERLTALILIMIHVISWKLQRPNSLFNVFDILKH